MDSSVPTGKTRVLIIGGGIAGLTVAHELSRVGDFSITVCDQNPELGGKARSVRTPDQLPLEHSMRVLLASYTCLYRIMREIPISEHGTVGGSTYDCLTYPRFSFSYRGQEHMMDAEYTGLWKFAGEMFGLLRFFNRVGVPYHELFYFLYKVGRLPGGRPSPPGGRGRMVVRVTY